MEHANRISFEINCSVNHHPVADLGMVATNPYKLAFSIHNLIEMNNGEEDELTLQRVKGWKNCEKTPNTLTININVS